MPRVLPSRSHSRSGLSTDFDRLLYQTLQRNVNIDSVKVTSRHANKRDEFFLFRSPIPEDMM
jgi:hypothetical protein